MAGVQSTLTKSTNTYWLPIHQTLKSIKNMVSPQRMRNDKASKWLTQLIQTKLAILSTYREPDSAPGAQDRATKHTGLLWTAHVPAAQSANADRLGFSPQDRRLGENMPKF